MTRDAAEIPTIAEGPFSARRVDGEIVIVDSNGRRVATLHGEYAHHDAPILVARMNLHEELVEENEGLRDQVAYYENDDDAVEYRTGGALAGART